MKLSQLLAGATAMAFVAGVASSAMADPGGTAATQQFQISGTVVSTCLLNVAAPNIALGNISINTVATSSPSTYFHMTTAGDILQAQLTGTAGCNSNSNVTLSKANGTEGLHNSTTAGFDQTVFTANIPYNFQLSWSGSNSFTPGAQPASPQSARVLPTEGNSSVATGAFASNVNFAFFAADPGLGLLAGTYKDTVTLTFTPS
jgi:hypothetical protein